MAGMRCRDKTGRVTQQTLACHVKLCRYGTNPNPQSPGVLVILERNVKWINSSKGVILNYQVSLLENLRGKDYLDFTFAVLRSALVGFGVRADSISLVGWKGEEWMHVGLVRLCGHWTDRRVWKMRGDERDGWFERKGIGLSLFAKGSIRMVSSCMCEDECSFPTSLRTYQVGVRDHHGSLVNDTMKGTNGDIAVRPSPPFDRHGENERKQ